MDVRRLCRSALALGLAGMFLARLAAAEPAAVPKSRADLVAQFDRNGDGRLDAAEREGMRLARQELQLSRKGSGFQIPADFLAKYDRDKDGEMQGEEWKVAWETETKILKETYDADKDGTLSKEEKKSMMAAVAAGKITGIPAFFAGRMMDDPGSTGAEPDYLVTQRELLKFDRNGDGLANADELESIRKSLPKTP